MKLLIQAILIFGFSSMAFCQNLTSGTETPFQVISSWQSTARPVVFSELADKVILGKCFSFATPTKAETIYLVVHRKLVDDDRGPAFPASSERKAALVASSVPRSDQIFSFFESNWSSFEHVVPADNSLIRLEQGDLKGEIRKTEDYFMTLAFLSKDIRCTAEVAKFCKDEVVPKGTLHYACYFYQEVKP